MSIVVEDYVKSYGTTVAVRGISFRVEPGEILGLVGPNGAGKTTTLRALAGILQPTRGRLFVDGRDVEREPVRAKHALAYIPDEPKLFDQLTVWEHFRFVAGAYRLRDWQERAVALLDRFELREKRDALTSELSRGMRQKVAICCGYLHQPKAVLLDEPMTGLDPVGIRTMKETIHELAASGTAYIISSHLLSLVEDICTSILVLNRGRQLLHGRLAEIRSQMLHNNGSHETLEQMFFRLIEAPLDVLPVAAEDGTL